jgi:hypothetical protein
MFHEQALGMLDLFPFDQLESGVGWRSNAGGTRGLMPRMRRILADSEGTVSLEFGSDNGWRLEVDGLIFSNRGFWASYRPLAYTKGIPRSVAMGIFSGSSVRFRGGSIDVFGAGQPFALPVVEGPPPVKGPPQTFALNDVGWIKEALGSSEFCLVRPGGQLAAASWRMAAMIGSGRRWRFHSIVASRLLQQALLSGPFIDYAFTPERLWLYGKCLNCEIPAESERPAFDPSPLIKKARTYRIRAEVEALDPEEWGTKTLDECLTLTMAEERLTMSHHRETIELAASVQGSSSQVGEWRLRSRPFVYALSRAESASVYLPECKTDPVGIQCGQRWMWILPE